MKDRIEEIRREYVREELLRDELQPDPYDQFDHWFKEAIETEGDDVNAMTLATSNAEGRVSARIVLLRGVENGFRFYTNYESRKGHDIAENPYAALVFWWRTQMRQVRVEGRVERLPEELSDEYFAGRPKGSRIGAIASNQSRVLSSREELDRRYRELESVYGEIEQVPRPDKWGGYCVVPDAVEFWQGRQNRLHDRFRYERDQRGNWFIERLAP